MLKKIITLYGLLLIIQLVMQTTMHYSFLYSEVCAQNYANEGDPTTWPPCALCHCNFDLHGDCCCGGVDAFSSLPCFCNACLLSYNCLEGHQCSALITGEGGNSSIGSNAGGNGYYTPNDNFSNSIDDFLDYITNYWSIFTHPDGYVPFPDQPIYTITTPTYEMSVATKLINKSNLSLATTHVSQIGDNANARQNILDTSKGLLAWRSNYENAPGGQVNLSRIMLGAIKGLLDTGYSISISEIAGGSHSVGSSHYSGIAVDINIVNGINVRYMSSVQISAFRSAAFAAGASQVYDPYHDPDGSHYNHFHIQW